MSKVSYAVEGWTDEPIAEKLILAAGRDPWRRYSGGGKSQLDPKIPGYNRSAATQPWLVLRDLDQDENCPEALVARLLGGPCSNHMSLRIPVRSLEAWALADREGFRSTFSVARSRIPQAPDALPDPKATVVDLCSHSTMREIREAMVPLPASRRKTGRQYGAYMRNFLISDWSADRARANSPSLEKALRRTAEMVERAVW